MFPPLYSASSAACAHCFALSYRNFGQFTSGFASAEDLRRAEPLMGAADSVAVSCKKVRQANKYLFFPVLDAAVLRNRRTNSYYFSDLFACLTSAGCSSYLAAMPRRHHGRRRILTATISPRAADSVAASCKKVRQANKFENMKNMDAELALNSPQKWDSGRMEANKYLIFPVLDAAVLRNRRTNSSYFSDLFACLTSAGCSSYLAVMPHRSHGRRFRCRP